MKGGVPALDLPEKSPCRLKQSVCHMEARHRILLGECEQWIMIWLETICSWEQGHWGSDPQFFRFLQ